MENGTPSPMTSTAKRNTPAVPCQDFEFVTLVGQPFEDSYTAGSRKLIRRHAMNDFIRRREASSSSSSLPSTLRTGLDCTVKPEGSARLIGKFKLSSWSRKKSRMPNAIEQVVESRRAGQAPKTATDWRDRRKGDQEQGTILVKAPSTDKFDPFDALPIEVGPGFEALMLHCKSNKDGVLAVETGCRVLVVLRPSINSLAINPEGNWFAYAAGDAALLHATLFLVALHRDLQLGAQLSSSCLYHRGEVIRTVNKRIGALEREISDATIGAVAFLANFETMNGTLLASRLHMNGLRQMIALRGGLHTLGQSQVLQRVVIWADFLYSTATCSKPSFPLIPQPTTLTKYSAASGGAMRAGSMILTGRTFLEPGCIDIIQDLRSLTVHAANPQSMSMLDRRAFSSMIYLLEYHLLSQQGGSSSVQKYSQTPAPLRIAAHLYLYLAVRELPSTAEMHYAMARKLQNATKGDLQADLDCLDYNYDLFLWIFFIGGAALYGQSERRWFVSELRIICLNMQISSLDHFTDRLAKILWHERFFTQHAATLWAEVEKSLA
ncbi:hypothetical protein MMC11_002648 [Xylographa trunciseda]|nr:hypothetical protein [Xylographa trunciseda]